MCSASPYENVRRLLAYRSVGENVGEGKEGKKEGRKYLSGSLRLGLVLVVLVPVLVPCDWECGVGGSSGMDSGCVGAREVLCIDMPRESDQHWEVGGRRLACLFADDQPLVCGLLEV